MTRLAGTPISGLQASSETLLALATGLARFGPAEGSNDWLVPFAWLCTEVAAYIATPMSNGLRIEPLASFLDRMRADVVRIGANAVLGPLPSVPDALTPPISLQPWTGEIIDVEVIRTAPHAAGLLFTGSEGANLLIANDPLGPGVVLTSESVEIAELLTDGERVELADYLRRAVTR